MTGVDVEHTKAHEKPCDHCVLIWQGWARAVERVQALHTPDGFGMCEGCGDNEHGYAIVPHPCPTIRELETP